MSGAVAAGPGPEIGAAAIESRSIDYVPVSERHGMVWQQGPFWFMGNFQPFTITIGFIGPAIGLSALQTIIFGTLGIGFGTLFMAFHATQGPHLGLPQMIQSRAQLGYRGVVIALLGSWVTFMLFNIVDVIILQGGINGIFGVDVTVIAIGTTVVAALLAIYGHDLLHRVFRLLFSVSLPFYAILTVVIAVGGIPATVAPVAATGGWAAMLAMFTAAAAYNITYAPYVSDYSRYLPRTTRTTPIVVSVFLGASGSAVWLIALGAWLATNLGSTDALVGLQSAGDAVFKGLGLFLAVLAVAALVATMGINSYSAMLSTLTAVDSIRPVQPTRNVRMITLVVLAVIWVVAAIVLGGNAVADLFNSLIVMLYLIVPWTAINLVDYFFVRRGQYAIMDLFSARGIYGEWGRRGIPAYVVGLASMTPFVLIPGWVKGPVVDSLGGADISAIVGLLVSALAYFALTRSLDLEAEAPAVAQSEQVIAASMA